MRNNMKQILTDGNYILHLIKWVCNGILAYKSVSSLITYPQGLCFNKIYEIGYCNKVCRILSLFRAYQVLMFSVYISLKQSIITYF